MKTQRRGIVSFLTQEIKTRFVAIFFFHFFIKNHPNVDFFAIMFKIKFSNNDIRSCSKTQIANINGFEALYSVLSQVFYVDEFAVFISEPVHMVVKQGFPE